MNILVLHNVEDLGRARRSTLDFIFAFERYQPGHTYCYQKITDPPSEEVVATQWNAVIFGSTALGIVTIRPRSLFFRILQDWSFLRDERILKIAFPQDDANCGGLRDDWLADWGFALIYSVRAKEHWQMLYPKSAQTARILPCLSGYVDDRTLPDLRRHAKPWGERSRLIGQRVTMYPPRGGRQGRLKGLIAEAVKSTAIARGLKADISTDPADTFFGDEWYSFLGDCKFVLGAEGGLSLNDPYGLLADKISDFLVENPAASFDDVETACFPGLDGLQIFSGFSPRILEVAVCRGSQVLVEGNYLGAIEPGTHYLCLKQDLSNLDAVLDALADEASAKRRIEACDEALVHNLDFRFSTLAAKVFGAINEAAPCRSVAPFDARRAKRGYVDVLARKARNEGFRWPELGDRVAAQIAGQQLPDDLAAGPGSEVLAAAKLQVLAAEVERLKSVTREGSPASTLADTLGDIAEALNRMLEAADEGPMPLAVTDGLAMLSLAFDRLRFSTDTVATPQAIGVAMNVLGWPADPDAAEAALGIEPASDMARLVRGLGESESTLSGLANRLAPQVGVRFTDAELQNLLKLDELLVRSSGTGLGAILRQLDLGERGERAKLALEAGGDISRLILALADPVQASALAGIVSRIAPRSGDRFTSEEVAALQELDRFVVLAGANPFEKFQPPEAGRADKVRASAEVLDWPSEGLALLVIEVLSQAGSDRDAADKIIGILRQSVGSGP